MAESLGTAAFFLVLGLWLAVIIGLTIEGWQARKYHEKLNRHEREADAAEREEERNG